MRRIANRLSPIPIALLAASCGSRETTVVAPPAVATCTVFDGAGKAGETVEVGLRSPVAFANAPVPTNGSEARVFRQLYETLTDIDCDGEVVGGLARSWETNADSADWLITLRSGIAYSDGTPLSAQLIIDGWTDRGVVGPDAFDAPLAMALDRRTIHIIADSAIDLPLYLSDPRFSVTRAAPNTSAPVGTSGYTVGATSSQRIELTSGGSAPIDTIVYRLFPGNDLRDLLDEHIDVISTDRPDVIGYADQLNDYVKRPLPWNRSYILFSGAGPEASSENLADQSYIAFLEELALNAVRGDARAHQRPQWWTERQCDTFSPGYRPTIKTIGYPQGDPIAKDIAERLTFLANSSETLPDRLSHLSGVTAQPIDKDQFTTYAEQEDAALVFGVNRFSRNACSELRAGVARPLAATPLVDTHETVIGKRNTAPMVVTGDGIPYYRTRR